MEMVDGLATVRAGVHDEPVAAVEVMRAGDVAGLRQQPAQQPGVLRQCVGMGGDVTLGNDEYVRGGLRVDVGEGEHVFGLVKALGG